MKDEIYSLFEEKVYNAAIVLLSKKDYSSQDLYRKLSLTTKASPSILDSVLARLKESHLLDDISFATFLFEKYLKKMHGPIRISYLLTQKGFSSLLIKEIEEKMAVDWYTLAESVRIKKFGVKIPNDQKTKTRVIRYLQYKGFPLEFIQID